MTTDAERLRQAHRYAVANGFATGWLNFEAKDYNDGKGPVWGVLLLPARPNLKSVDVPVSELHAPSLTDVAGVYRAAHRWSNQHGYATAIPTMEQANYGAGTVYGIVPIPHDVTHVDIPLTELDGHPSFGEVSTVFRSVNRWTLGHHSAVGFPVFEKAAVGGKVVYGAFYADPSLGVEHRDVSAPWLFETVTDFTVKSITYDLARAHIINDTVTDMLILRVSNATPNKQTTTLAGQVSFSESRGWSTSVAVKLSATVSGEASIPLVAGGKISVTSELTTTIALNGTVTEGKVFSYNVPITLDPHSAGIVLVQLSVASLVIPYTAVGTAHFSSGRVIDDQSISGIYTGTNAHDINVMLQQSPL